MIPGNPKQLVTVLSGALIINLPGEPLRWEGGSGRRIPRADVTYPTIELGRDLFADVGTCAIVGLANE